MPDIELSASMMCADYACLRDEVKNLIEAGIDIFHIDIMDGSFVDNFGMGYQDMAFIKNNTNFILFLTKHVIICISYFSKIRQIIKNT